MKGNFVRVWRFLLLTRVLSCLALALSLTGCDQVRSLVNSVTKLQPVAGEHTSGHRPNSSASAVPRLAIILDDVGSDPAGAEAIFALRFPLTLSVLPNHSHSAEIAAEAHRRGYQIMLHLPMQSLGNEIPEPQQLLAGMSSSQVSQDLTEMLAAVPNAAGVNNHQGSLATTDSALMAELMPLLREHHLYFIDSRTTTATVAYDTAKHDGVPCAFRNVPFLDDVQEEAAIRRQLELVIRAAKERGGVIAIGHPHPETLRVLSEMLPRVQAQGVHLVHASELVR